jgi:HD-GYP domain-containing protein (c-di-GMP phosphodiesterase class II)
MQISSNPLHETLAEELIQSQPEDLIRHGQTVARLTTDLAEAAGCPPVEQSRIHTGSLLHDIGKQFIPTSILEKKDKLSPSEFSRIQQHPWFGYVYLTSFVSDATVLNTILYHHERWNGTGYPFGLAGEQIPLGARICALADVWDALVSDRCYRSAWSLTQALDLIWAGAGSLFDPQLAYQFLNIIETQYGGTKAVQTRDVPAFPWAGRAAPAWEGIPLSTRRSPRKAKPAAQ